jgi:16S rRNA (guanine527-N7)-methyltransferase
MTMSDCSSEDSSVAFINDLNELALAAGLTIDDRQLSLFSIYYRELLFWNRHMNIVSDRSSREIAERHFIDSLMALPFLTKERGTLVDLGSGGGFPGIPLKIMRSDMKVLLLDSSRKKISFLSNIIAKLGLENITAERCRIEDVILQENYARTFDTVISRAAFKLDLLVRFSSSLLKDGGLLIALKGRDVKDELDSAEEEAKMAGMELQSESDQEPPTHNSNRKIIIYKRMQHNFS